uniref:Uncharacterized protein n=1 Tax=Manihot esculenta TaxID=3983 RepID=A0A2C9URB0_MANES
MVIHKGACSNSTQAWVKSSLIRDNSVKLQNLKIQSICFACTPQFQLCG